MKEPEMQGRAENRRLYQRWYCCPVDCYLRCFLCNEVRRNHHCWLSTSHTHKSLMRIALWHLMWWQWQMHRQRCYILIQMASILP